MSTVQDVPDLDLVERGTQHCNMLGQVTNRNRTFVEVRWQLTGDQIPRRDGSNYNLEIIPVVCIAPRSDNIDRQRSATVEASDRPMFGAADQIAVLTRVVDETDTHKGYKAKVLLQ